MRRFAFVLGGFVLTAAACNSISGAGDLEICTGVECPSGNPTGSSSGTGGVADAATSSGSDGNVVRDGGGFDASTCSECPEACENGTCLPWPSCRAGNLKCGTTQNGGLVTSCCESKPVPGGTFNRVNEGDETATISAYSLDVYDVTVARFRAFVAAGQGIATSPPAAGSGAHPKIAGSGWKQAWSAQLSNTTALLEEAVTGGTYTKTPGPNESKPMTNVTWFEAYAFCIWDGGRLPTFNEWNFAATGGSEQRLFPWSVPPSNESIDKTRAAYECRFNDPPLSCPPQICVNATPAQTGPCDATACTAAGGTCQDQPCTGCDVEVDLAPVGQLPAGAGKFGQLDLSGNVSQIVLDARPKNAPVDFPNPCNDCALLMGDNPKGGGGVPSYEFFVVSGDWGDDGAEMHTSQYGKTDFRGRFDWLGFRCARDR